MKSVAVLLAVFLGGALGLAGQGGPPVRTIPARPGGHPSTTPGDRLHAASQDGDYDLVKKLLEEGTGPNGAGPDGETHVMAALLGRPSERGRQRSDIALLLLDRGADIEARDAQGNSILLLVCRRHDLNFARLLLDRGAKTGATNHDGATGLMLSALGTRGDVRPLFQLLISRGADIQARDNRGQTALFYAVTERFSEAGGFQGNPDAVDALVEMGASVDTRDQDGQTPLIYDARQQPIVSNAPLEIMRRLLAKRADIDALDAGGETALMIVAERGRKDFANFLMEQGANLDIRKPGGDSALQRAIESAQGEMVDLLLAKGATLSTTSYATREAALEALRNFQFLRASEECDVGKAQALLERGADVHFRDRNGSTALMRSVGGYREAAPTVELLLAGGADINAQDKSGNTALMLSAAHPQREAVDRLLAKGADVLARNQAGRTALLNAAEAGESRTVSRLLAKGADVNARDATGKTALILAGASDDAGLLQSLLNNGADINAADNEGRTALMAAATGAHDDGVQLLLARGASVNARTKRGVSVIQLVQAAQEEPGIPRAFIVHLGEIIAVLRKAGATN